MLVEGRSDWQVQFSSGPVGGWVGGGRVVWEHGRTLAAERSESARCKAVDYGGGGVRWW